MSSDLVDDQLKTLPVPHPFGSQVPFEPLRGLPLPNPIPFSYSHLLFNPTLARLPFLVGVLVLSVAVPIPVVDAVLASKSLTLKGELRAL